MRITRVLFKQNQWRTRKAIWQAQSNRKILETNAEDALHDVTIYDANEIAANPLPPKLELNTPGEGPMTPIPASKNHPDYNEDRILCFKDNNVLLEGLKQAKALTNTIEPEDGEALPEQLTNLMGAVSSPNQDQLVNRCIEASLIYEAEQVKLPIRKDPKQPAWTFPRDYGICDKRRNELICKRLLQFCEMISYQNGNQLSEERFVLNDALFSVPLNWNENSILFNLTADLLVASKSALSPIASAENHKSVALPDMHPLSPIVSLEETNYYQLIDKFPMKSGPQDLQLHTAFVYYNETEVRNLYGTPVEEEQITGRTLLKSYAFAVAQARQNFGTEISGPLPTPITVQTIHTNCQWFHFSVFQLNTFDMYNSRLRNYFWSIPMINLYSFCGYKEGRPKLINYNPEVFKTLLAFYNR